MSQWTHQSNYTINGATQDFAIVNLKTTHDNTVYRIYHPIDGELWWNGNQIMTGGSGGTGTLENVGNTSTDNTKSTYAFSGTTTRVVFESGGSEAINIGVDDTSFSGGTVAIPGINFIVDTDTGVYRIGANNLGISCGGAKCMGISTTEVDITIEDAVLNDVTHVLNLQHTTTLAAGDGVGTGIKFGTETAGGTVQIGNTLESIASNAGPSEDFDMVIKNMTLGIGVAETLRITSIPQVVVNQFGNSLEPGYSFKGFETNGLFHSNSSTVVSPPNPLGVGVGPGPSWAVDGVMIFKAGSTAGPSYQVCQFDGNFLVNKGAIYTRTNTTTEATHKGVIQAFGGGQIISGNQVGPTVGEGIIRCSATGGADWEDGHLGNSEAIYFTATDFVQGANATFAGLQSAVSKLTPMHPAPNESILVHNDTTLGGGPWIFDTFPSTRFGAATGGPRASIQSGPDLNTVVSTTTTANLTYTADYVVGQTGVSGNPYVGMTTNSNSVLVAQKIIPKGFRIGALSVGPPAFAADTCTIFGQANTTLTSLFVWSQTVASPSNVTQLHNQTPYIMNNTSNNFIGTAVGDGTALVTIVIDLGTPLTTVAGLLGAKITMQRV